jgi:hypothetical protein
VPAKRRQPRRRRKADMVTPEDYKTLQHGCRFFGPNREMDRRSLWKSASLRTEMRGAWQFLAPQLLREWITLPTRGGDHGGPGTRPAAWWVYEAKQRRRRVDGKPHPFDNPERQAKIGGIVAQYPHREGDLSYLYYGWIGAYVVPDDHDAVVETEFDYLKRLNLLFDGEEALYLEQQRRAAERERLNAEGRQ